MENVKQKQNVLSTDKNEKQTTFGLEFLKLIAILMSAVVLFYLIKVFVL